MDLKDVSKTQRTRVQAKRAVNFSDKTEYIQTGRIGLGALAGRSRMQDV